MRIMAYFRTTVNELEIYINIPGYCEYRITEIPTLRVNQNSPGPNPRGIYCIKHMPVSCKPSTQFTSFSDRSGCRSPCSRIAGKNARTAVASRRQSRSRKYMCPVTRRSNLKNININIDYILSSFF